MNIVYKYSLRPPTLGAKEVDQQIHLGHQYKNASIEVLRERRAASRKLAEECATPKVKKLEVKVNDVRSALEEASTKVKEYRSKARTRTTPPEMLAAITAKKALLKELSVKLNEARKEAQADPEVIKKRVLLKKESFDKIAKIYATEMKDLHWGTRYIVDSAMKKAAEAPLYAAGEPNDPKFRQWTGEGSLGLSLHQCGPEKKGLPVPSIFKGTDGAENWVTITKAPPRVIEKGSAKVQAHRARNAARRKKALANGGGSLQEDHLLTVRVGTNEDRSPKMVQFPITLHRPLPPKGIVTNLKVFRRKVGPREEWSVAFNVKVDGIQKERAPLGAGTVVVDLGWSVLDPKMGKSGIQVARWLDDKGNAGTIELLSHEPKGRTGGGALSAFTRASEITETRDEEFEWAKTKLLDFFKTTKMPEWARRLTARKEDRLPTQAQASAAIQAWRSKAKLAKFILTWDENRIEGDAIAFKLLTSWRYHDFHLWSWETSQAKKAIRRRQNIYRTFAATLAKKYSKVVVHDSDYSTLKRRAKVEDESPFSNVTNYNQQVASPGEFRLEIQKAFESRGGEFSKVPVGKSCPSCQNTDLAVDERDVYCSECNGSFDVDDLGCMNLMRAAGLPEAVKAILKRNSDFRKKLGKPNVRVSNVKDRFQPLAQGSRSTSRTSKSSRSRLPSVSP